MRKKKREKYWYIQDWGTYLADTLVFVGYKASEIATVVKRQKGWKKDVQEGWLEHLEAIPDNDVNYTLKKNGNTMLILSHFEDDWDCYEILMHECFHLVMYQLGDIRNMVGVQKDCIKWEEEALAYQQEYLFRNIRQKLYDNFYSK